jgi:hypothetical protein
MEYAGAFGGTATFSRTVDMARYQGLHFARDNPDMKGNVASNPTEIVYYHLSLWNQASATVVGSDVQVLIEYDILFQEPKMAPLS